MKRFLTSSLILGLLALPTVGLVGCGEESKVKEKETVSGPGGSTTTVKEEKVNSTGNNPPANTEGKTGKSGP